MTLFCPFQDVNGPTNSAIKFDMACGLAVHIVDDTKKATINTVTGKFEK